MHRWILSIAFAVTACSGTGTRPDWIDGNSAKYDAQHYLIGRGQGDTRETAQDRARADLAKIFAVAVDATSIDTTAYRSGGPKEQAQTTQAITRTISAATEQLLRGSEIADLWRNPADNSYHALAILRRNDAAAQLRRELAQCDGRTQAYLANAQAADALSRAGNLYRALDTQRGCQGTRAALIAVGENESVSQEDTKRLLLQLSAALNATRIRVEADDDIANRLRAALSQAGFGQGDDYVLQAKLNLEDLGERQGWYWTGGALELRLRDRAGHMRGEARWPLKVAAAERNLTAARAREQLEILLKEQLRTTLLGFAAE